MRVDELQTTRYLRVLSANAFTSMARNVLAMSAVVRDRNEDQVASRETLEAQIKSIDTGVTEVKTDVRELRADNKTLRDKMDEGFRALDAKMERKNEALQSEMNNGFRAQGAKVESLNEKVTKLSADVADIRSLQKAMIWMIGGLGSLITILITTGKALHWF